MKSTQIENSKTKRIKTTPGSLRELLIRIRLPLLLLVHIVLFTFIYWGAFLMRFTLNVPSQYVEQFLEGVVFVVGIKVGVFFCMRSIHGWWRHVNFSDFISLFRSALIASTAIISLDYFLLDGQIPRTVILNDFVLTIVLIGGLRSVWRVWDERIVPLDRSRVRERALLIGNDFESARMAHLINAQHSLGIRVLGMVAAGPFVKGRRYSDIRIVGPIASLGELMQRHRAQTLFVINGTVPAKKMRDLLDSATHARFDIKIIPRLEEQLRGSEELPIRKVAFNDLLRREPIELDLNSISKTVEGKTILVTGAGGSIGSELCRQLSRFGPKKIILLGRGENRIYQIERELKQSNEQVEFLARIASITDKQRMEEIFATFQPDLVFHAAAHKHVPLVEQNVGESIINNVLGTKTVADVAHQFGVERFVMVSTDKSVNPTSVMGCTKQMAERYCQSLGNQSQTRFISTRFGNVLGSAGSVVPLFQEQIQKGGPLTITDKRMTRYFMTIPEASQLVIQAAAIGTGGEIFVLEMGEPVKILDLAKDLIRLAGHDPNSIDILETGIRPGEKLYEELYYTNEESIPTEHHQILSSSSRMFSIEQVESQVQELVDAAYQSPHEIVGLLKQFIPEFDFNGSVAEFVPPASERPAPLSRIVPR